MEQTETNTQQQTTATETAVDNNENNTQTQTNLLNTEAAKNVTEDTERPTWLPEKFKTAEDLAKSYTELEKTLADKSPKVPEQYDFSYAKEFGLADMDDELRGEVTQAFQSAKLPEENKNVNI